MPEPAEAQINWKCRLESWRARRRGRVSDFARFGQWNTRLSIEGGFYQDQEIAQQHEQFQQGRREDPSNFSPDEYNRGSAQPTTQAAQWKARQQAAKSAGGAQFVSAQEHYGRVGGEKSHILRQKQQQHLKAEQEILSPMGTTSKSSVARARRLARDDVH